MRTRNSRREFLCFSTAVGSGLILNACGVKEGPESEAQKKSAKAADEQKGGEVTATEDLMREHGVLRRALLVYTAAASRLRGGRAANLPDSLGKTAKLFRAFGEEYHEKMLEEAYIFPAVKKAGGPAALYPDILLAQHQRGREITEFILSVAQAARLDAARAESLAQALDSLVLMYRHHAACEDTIIFPAWKLTMTTGQLDEIGDKFEEIEHQQFGADGFEDAVKQIGDIESRLGLADLAQFTAPPLPKL